MHRRLHQCLMMVSAKFGFSTATFGPIVIQYWKWLNFWPKKDSSHPLRLTTLQLGVVDHYHLAMAQCNSYQEILVTKCQQKTSMSRALVPSLDITANTGYNDSDGTSGCKQRTLHWLITIPERTTRPSPIHVRMDPLEGCVREWRELTSMYKWCLTLNPTYKCGMPE